MKIALAGNPNSGKTTVFNALTGKSEKVGNWAGVTVEKKEGLLKKSFYNGEEDIYIIDLPGTYSMSPFTSEEGVTRDFILNENPDVILNIVDGTNLSRSLFFTTQLMELGIPVVIAINKSDINEKKQTVIDSEALSLKLSCPVFETSINSIKEFKALIGVAISLKGKGQAPAYISSISSDKSSADRDDRKRFKFVNGIVSSVEKRKILTREKTLQDKFDVYLTNKWIGIPFFAVVMFLVFQISQAWVGPFIADGITLKNGFFIPGLSALTEALQELTGSLLTGVNPLLYSLVVDGIIGGVGAVIGFLPLVMVMYFLIALLEDCGYMSRVSVVLDPIFKRVGLSGKSVIPMVIGTGCAVPGVMACRTIRDERERRATAMLTPFMPCGAKLPVIALFSGVFFSDATWIGTLMYFMGIIVIFFGALIVNKITGNKAKKSYFIIELPEYKFPSLKGAFLAMCQRGWAYIVKAGTVILICNTLIQIMQSYTPSFTPVEEGMAHTSILAAISNPVAVLLVPLGFGVWQMTAAALSGFIAKENVVGTIAVCYGITNFIDTEALAVTGGVNEVAMVLNLTKAAALSCLVFNLFTPPCFAAMGAMNSELKSAKWFWSGIALQLSTGYTLSFIVYQVGTFIETGAFGQGFTGGLIAVLIFTAVIAYLCIKGTSFKNKKGDRI
ncbi:MAG: ferrous iron transporter B [Ruminococcaceae bacterium]|nr:ferrous iron transporter B [Oscillospiraceae bacterium]